MPKKISELATVLRYAVDNYLWDGTGERPGLPGTQSAKHTAYVCVAIERATNNARALNTLKALVMEDISSYNNATTFNVALSRAAQNAEERTVAWTKDEEVQAMRFMYADFLAHYLESEGL